MPDTFDALRDDFFFSEESDFEGMYAIAEDAVCGNAHDDMDGDAVSALASIGWGMDEDYYCQGYDEW